MLDVYSQSPSWVQMANMLDERIYLGVGVLGDSIYAVGGFDGYRDLNSVEVFNVSTKEWRMVSCMMIKRSDLGLGLLNKGKDNRLYAVGGRCGSISLKSVEYYNTKLDKWIEVTEMNKYREGAGVGVLGGKMYVVGGYSGYLRGYHKSVEAYSLSVGTCAAHGVWSPVPSMNIRRFRPGFLY